MHSLKRTGVMLLGALAYALVVSALIAGGIKLGISGLESEDDAMGLKIIGGVVLWFIGVALTGVGPNQEKGPYSYRNDAAFFTLGGNSAGGLIIALTNWSAPAPLIVAVLGITFTFFLMAITSSMAMILWDPETSSWRVSLRRRQVVTAP